MHRRVAIVRQRTALEFPLEQAPAARIRMRAVGARGVELVGAIDHFGEGLRIPGSGVRQVLGDLRGEFRIPDRGVELPFGVEQPFRVPDVDDGRARLAHRRERRVDHPVHVGVGSKEVAGGADARAFQRVGAQLLRVVGPQHSFAFFRGGVRGVDAGHDPERHRDVVHAPRHRASGVEAERERDDARSAEHTVRRFEADDAVRCGRSANRSAGVGAHAERRVRRRNRDAGAARRP